MKALPLARGHFIRRLVCRFTGLYLEPIRGRDGVEKLSKGGHSGGRGQHKIAKPYLTFLQSRREFS